ncbi:phosphopantetheine-binding protein [Catellatospora vulcania]|uniref:phosphopantetheine-binding protein n=1 Tax=Catellatospora vulcania TaxID=1460450 RepID=UPI0012D419F2|nr:phosphopantetheine-binding protein [Catellatospora vulcania]
MEQNDIFAMVRGNLSTVIPELDADEITMDATLTDLGCNSIDRAEVVTMTMSDMGIHVPVMEFQEAGDIRSLVRLLARHTA